MPLEDDALEDLDALLVALDDPVVDAHRVADAEVGQVRPEELGLDFGELGEVSMADLLPEARAKAWGS